MRFIERHWKIGPRALKLPLVDLARVPVDYSNLANRSEIDKDLRAFLLDLKRLWMRAELEIFSDLLIGCGVKHSDSALTAVAVPNVDALCHWIVTQLIGVVGILHGVDQLVRIRVKHFARAIAFVRD